MNLLACFKFISMAKFTWCIVVVCLWGLESGWCSQDLIAKMSKGFGGALEECKKELNAGDHIMNDFFNFWRENYELLNRDLGCMVICMGQKMGLVDADMKMHHGNAQEYAQKHGADEDKAKQLVTLIHECEKNHEAIEDHCARVLEASKCFRTKIHELQWAPSMSVIMEEFMNAL